MDEHYHQDPNAPPPGPSGIGGGGGGAGAGAGQPHHAPQASFPPPHAQNAGGGGGGGSHGPHAAQSQSQAQAGPSIPQLPPQMFTTAAQLLDLTDKKLMVALRDGRKLVGVLRSWDQFANLVLQDTVERVFAHNPNLFADIERGTFIVRGENVTLIGEIDLDKDDEAPPGYAPAPAAHVFTQQKREREEQRKRDRTRQTMLHRIGFEGELAGGEGALML